jgi:putative peptide maturation system protein
MNENAIRATMSSLRYIEDLARDQIRPEEARSGLRLLQGRFPELQLDLLWEEEAYDQSVHYDVLVHHPGEGTVSLSWCPDRSLPWPLRGARRWSEADLVRVNEVVLKVDQAVACLDFIWDEARIVDRLVNVCLIQETLEKEPIELSEAELQTAMDGFRRAHKLYKAEDTRRWMERHAMTHEQLESLVPTRP